VLLSYAAANGAFAGIGVNDLNTLVPGAAGLNVDTLGNALTFGALLGFLAAIFGVINAYIRPVVKMLSLPLTLLTFGLIGFVINTALVMLAAFVGGTLHLGFALAGWPPAKIGVDTIVAALLTSIVISIVSSLMAFVRLAVPGRR